MTSKLCTPQISWHGTQPVLSVDVSRKGLLATGGADNNVRLWRVASPDESNEKKRNELVVFVQDLSSHSRPVNSVRFSPDGGTRTMRISCIHVT